MDKICKKCKQERNIGYFLYIKKKKVYRNVCTECRNKQNQIAKSKLKKEIFIYKEPTKEWEKADIFYVSKDADKYVSSKPIYKFCSFCTVCINTTNTSQKLYEKGFCSKWCEEILNPPIIRNVCKNTECGQALMPYRNKRGHSNGQFAKYCEDCIIKNRLIKKIQ